ncbi:growth-regulating factor 5-like isoform X2 [Phoenix dactylifera]|uniref:Growth-regulating factor n=1 Tax=Phoenix dactylifera TaxID=42345 RepID=A0A8B7CNG9_PHODC|nr:growth-regulating factor 5-like isoform X2 [Phoenix dactylifera]
MMEPFTSPSPASDPTAPVPNLFWRPLGGESLERRVGIETGGVAGGEQMSSTAAARPLFTVSQWQELELQARIFKHLATGEAVPVHLVEYFRKSLESMASRSCHHPAAAAAAALGYYSYFGKKLDPEPGRCRRTDGKKWRCSKEAYPDSKYCERHMHRGRNRSRKPVEAPPQSQSRSPCASTVTSPALTGSSGNGGGSFQSIPLHSLAGGSTAACPFPGGAAASSPLLIDPGSYTVAEKELRYPYGMKAEVDEHSFFSEASGNSRGLGIDSSLDSSWRPMPSRTSLFPLSKARSNSSLQSSYLQFTTLQELGQASISSLSKPEQQQHSFSGSEFGLAEPVKHESHSLRPFFDEWPGTRDMWPDLEDDSRACCGHVEQ